MRLRLFILLLIGVSASFSSMGQASSAMTQSRILILLDESSSMLQPWAGGKEKHLVANQLILRLIDSVYSVNKEVEFSLRVFGSQHGVLEHNCTDTKNEVPFSKYNKTQMEFRLDDIQPYGGTCIAYSLSEAAEQDLVDAEHIAYSIVLITDGGESCDGDICAVMKKLLKNKIYFKPYILSLEDVSGLKDEYACLGNYLPITKKSDIPKAVGTIVESFRPMLNITKEDYKTLQEIGIPSVLKVNTSGTVKVDKEKPVDVPVEVKPKTTKPKPEVKVEDKPKPADTVATVKKTELPKSNIVVGEEQKLPPPVTIKRARFSKPIKLFYAPIGRFRAQDVAAAAPEFKQPEPPVVLPEPTHLIAVKATAVKKRKIQKPELLVPADVAVEAPVIKIPEPPAEKPEPVKLKIATASAVKKIKIPKVAPYSPQDVAVSAPVLNIKAPEVAPVAPVPVKLATVKATKPKKLPVDKTTVFSAPANVKVGAPVINVKAPEVPVVVAEPEVKKVAPKLTKLKLTAVKKRNLLYGGSFFDDSIKMIKMPPPPTFKLNFAAVAPVVTPTVTPLKPVKPAANEPKKLNPAVNTAEYSVTQEEAKETSMVVYLTNGKGKYFPVTPKVVLTDAVSNKEIKKFYRTVDAAGQPDPITNIATGKYYLTIEGREDLIASVDLLPNKRTRVEIVVKKYSLFFYYYGNPKRPVKEFNARVIQRNMANGRVVEQKCTEKLEYEPGNYHININTFPEDVRNIDLESNSEGGIGIKEPGFVKFTNESKVTSASLNLQQGDRFAQFYTMNLSDPATKHLQIQPGRYQVVFNPGPSKFSPVKVIEFLVKSNEETEVILKQ